ncbi:MAG: hypothetical protein JXQ73_11855 [Phycisphaerae bacterium]|nr:hypothetical protein [Phycisphaerae bacterium]
MGKASSSGPLEPAARRAVNLLRAAGSTTVIAGVLIVLYYVLALALTPGQQSDLAVAAGLILGVVLCGLGVMTLLLRTGGLWPTMIIAGILLAMQLLNAFMSASGQGQETLSVFALVVPLIVLVFNTLAVGAARTLPAKE